MQDESFAGYHTAREQLRKAQVDAIQLLASELASHYDVPLHDSVHFVEKVARLFSDAPATVPGSAGWLAHDFTRVRDALETYLTRSTIEETKAALDEFTNEALRILLLAGFTRDTAWEILADVMLVALFQTARAGVWEEFARYGNAQMAFLAFPSEGTLHDNLRKEFRRIQAKATEPLAVLVESGIKIVGYDPRIGTHAKSQYERWLEGACAGRAVSPEQTTDTPAADARTVHRPAPIAIFKDAYPLAKSLIHHDFHDQRNRYDLLLVDYAWLPELAYQGHVIPLERYAARKTLVERFQAALRKAGTRDTETWTRVLTALTSAGNEQIYCFPAWLNFHVVAHRDKSTTNDLHEALKASAPTAALQGKASACSTYELFAHFAYEGHIPIRVIAEAPDRPDVEVSFITQPSIDAFAMYIARRRVFDAVHDRAKARHFDHEKELDFLAGVDKWDPAFNSEFWSRAPDGLNPAVAFRNPRSQSYLCSLGGFGIAISRHSRDPRKAFDFAEQLFYTMQTQGTQKLGMLSNLASHLPRIDVGELDRFMRVHIRPRLPFWTHVEEAISSAVEEVETAFSYHNARNRAVHNPQHFDAVFEGLRTFLASQDEAQAILKRLEDRVRLTCTNYGWGVIPRDEIS